MHTCCPSFVLVMVWLKRDLGEKNRLSYLASRSKKCVAKKPWKKILSDLSKWWMMLELVAFSSRASLWLENLWRSIKSASKRDWPTSKKQDQSPWSRKKYWRAFFITWKSRRLSLSCLGSFVLSFRGGKLRFSDWYQPGVNSHRFLSLCYCKKLSQNSCCESLDVL